MSTRKTETINLQGNMYAKVAERLKVFREENPKGKHESDYTVNDKGEVTFKVWLWKTKKDLLDLMKAGITDVDTLRSSADSNGTAKSDSNDTNKKKDFEKLESIALGRALANLGYLASGEIASSEEMEEFLSEKEIKKAETLNELIEKIATINDEKELKEFYKANRGVGVEFDRQVGIRARELKANKTKEDGSNNGETA